MLLEFTFSPRLFTKSLAHAQAGAESSAQTQDGQKLARNEPGLTLPRAPGLCPPQGARPALLHLALCLGPGGSCIIPRPQPITPSRPPQRGPSPPAAILPGSARTPAQPRGAAPGLSAV